MTAYARLDPIAGTVNAIVNLTQAQFDALNGNPKQAYLKPLVIDTQPVPAASQIVVDAGYVIEAAQVRQTWALRAKTETELLAASQATELAAIKSFLTQLDNFITANDTAAPTTAAQAFADIATIKVVLWRLARGMRWVIKQQG